MSAQDHANDARDLVTLSDTHGVGPYDGGMLAAAQVHATLATAGQLERIADSLARIDERLGDLREDLSPLAKVVATFGSRLD